MFDMKVLILGATGLVGRNALAQILAQPAVTQVIAPTREPLTQADKPGGPKLELLLPEVTGWEPDAAICATGTTIKKAGSKEAFRSVDHDLPLSFARLAHQAGTQNFALVSAMEHRSIRPRIVKILERIDLRCIKIKKPSSLAGRVGA
jgi:uncharacterized protein YbjT (DUF2867 family)